MTTPLIDIDNLHFCYAGSAVDALAGLDMQVAEGEFVAVVGANGSGKSTLARLLGGLEKASGGRRLDVCGHDLLTATGRQTARRDVGVLFQNPENQIVGENVEEDLAFGLENIGLPSAEIAARVDEMVARFDLRELRRRQPHLLSGGQKQRVALAGVLAIPRRVLVLDEPTAMLDPAGRDEVLAAVRAAWGGGLTVVFVTQEMDEVLDAGRVFALEAGAVVFEGTPADLFADAALVRRLSLGLPAAGEVALALQARGHVAGRLALTLDELAADLGAPHVERADPAESAPGDVERADPAEGVPGDVERADPAEGAPHEAHGEQGSLW